MLPNNYTSSGCNLEALLLYDRDLFANLQVPEGVDKVQVVSRIRRDHGLAPLWHPDPIYLKNEIYWWSSENLPIWRKLFATTQLDYNPIWNTDATERVTDVTKTERDTSANSTALNHGGSTANRQGTSKDDGWDTHDTAYQEDTVGDTHHVQDQDTTGTSHTVTDVHTTGQADGTINETTKGTVDTTVDTTTRTQNDGTVNETTEGTSKTQTDGDTKGTSSTTTDGTSTKTGTVEETVSAENADTYQPDTLTTSEENITSHETVAGNTTGESHETVDGKTTGEMHNDHHDITDGTGKSVTDTDTTGEMHNDHHDTTVGTSHTVSDTNTTGTLDDTQDTHTTGHKETTTKEKGAYGDTGETHDTEENKHHDRTENWEAGKENAKVTYQHGWTKQGNIGVTSTQQLIAEERDSVQFNIYQFIADSFQRTFCLDIY